MSEGNKPYVLGTDTYTLADVFVTAMLTRCKTDPLLWTTEVETRPQLTAYWKRV